MCRALKNCFWLALIEGIASSPGFLRFLHFYVVKRILCLFVAFALSTTASVVYLFGISRRFSSAARAMLPNQSRSTVDARAERFPFAIQAQFERLSPAEARDRLAFSETPGVRTTEAVFSRLSISSLLIFARKSQIPERIQMSLAALMRSMIIF